MSTETSDYTTWHVKKTRVRTPESDWLEKKAQHDDRSVASILRRLVREAMEKELER